MSCMIFFAKVDGTVLIMQNKWKIRLQLMKPVTWPPLVWGVVCGAAASGTFLPFKQIARKETCNF